MGIFDKELPPDHPLYQGSTLVRGTGSGAPEANLKAPPSPVPEEQPDEQKEAEEGVD